MPKRRRFSSLLIPAISRRHSPREALRLDIKIQSVNTKKGNALEPHHKFRSGTLWLSNDSTRILLRAEVQIFVGYVFAELAAFHPILSTAPLL